MDTNNGRRPPQFENDLQTILSDYLSEALSGNINEGEHTFYTREPIIPNIPNTNRPNTNRPTTRNTDRLDTNRILNDLNQNITLYNNNMNLYLRIVQETMQLNRREPQPPTYGDTDVHIRPPPPSIPPYNTNRANSAQPNRYNNHIWSDLFTGRRNNAGQGDVFINPLQNVIVRPTVAEIEQSTENVEYRNDISDNFINQRCPISLDDFQTGDRVRRITHCGHTFNEVSFQSWFQRNVRCPVCRFDIRESHPVQDEPNIHPPNEMPVMDRELDTPSISRSDSLQSIFNDIADELSSSLTSYMQTNADASNNITGIRLEIPIQYTEIYDNSNNLLRREFN